MNDAIKMQVSAFVDGELPDNEAELLVRRLSQDVELRQQVADYLAIGRVMRRESGVAGVERLRDRISAELDDRPSQDAADRAPTSNPSRLLRPLAGVAIAATVAVVAILGLRQTTGPGEPGVNEIPAAVAATDVTYTEPALGDDMLRQYRLIHDEISSDFDVSDINARLMTLQLRDAVYFEEVPDGRDVPAADAVEDPAPANSQPQ
ncbi:MAG: sigma-E factor negative regulatory protein [Woeseiaceae bacterium]